MSMLTTFLYQYGLFAMVILIFLEYACFPVSSEIILPLSGTIAAMNHIPYFYILPFSILAGLAGTSVCYAIGRIGGSFLLEKFIRRFPKSQKPIEASYKKFNQFGSVAVSLSRLIPLCRTYIAFVAGAVKLDYPSYLIASFFGITVWNAVLIGLGFLLGDNWRIVVDYYNRYKGFLLLLIPLLLFLFLLLYRKLHRFR